jgi:hypothetical protein
VAVNLPNDPPGRTRSGAKWPASGLPSSDARGEGHALPPPVDRTLTAARRNRAPGRGASWTLNTDRWEPGARFPTSGHRTD